MILGFLGKGGSGKSTVATQMALWLHSQGKEVLAIDADHNMDLAYNLTGGNLPEMNHLGSSREDLFATLGLEAKTKFRDGFLQVENQRFRINDDEFSKTFIHELKDRMMIMSAGPQTEKVLAGNACSHSLSAPLKVYLPLLELEDNQSVVVDEKAGADGASTGIVTGFDLGVIVTEPAMHSIKTAKQIAELLSRFNVPHIFIANKVQSEDDISFIKYSLEGQNVAATFGHSLSIQRNPEAFAQGWLEELANIHQHATAQLPTRRYERTREKFSGS